MNCTNCIEAKPIPVCTGELIIGTVDTSEEVYVFIENIATGYIAMQSAVPSEYDSSISINMGEPYPDFYSSNFYFKLWVSDAEDGNAIVPLTIDEIEYECLTIIFQKLHTDDTVNHLTEVSIKV
jgi:hypothetical protein